MVITLKDMMEEVGEELQPYIQDYKLFLIAPGEMEDYEISKMKTSLGEVFWYIKYSKDKKRLAEIVAGNERYKHLEREAVMVINTVTKSNIPLKEEEEEINMCQALEEMKEDAREEGRELGRGEGNIYLIRRKINKGISGAQISEHLELEESYVMNVIRIMEANPCSSDLEIVQYMNEQNKVH